MKGLGHRNGAFGLIVEMAIPTNDRVCWFGDGVDCVPNVGVRDRFPDRRKQEAVIA